MRITGGGARGITLVAPKGDSVRPATDGMRQAVFSSLAARVGEAWFVDLFAGSGAYGLEAVSRGAAGGWFVERSPKAVACVRRNISSVCKSLQRGEHDLAVAQSPVLDWNLPKFSTVPDLVFVDPPYEIIPSIAKPVFEKLTELLKTKADPVIVFEMPGELTLEPEGWACVRRLGKGARQPTVAFFRRAGKVQPAVETT